MNHRQLETFRAVMRSGSASRAAELLHVTQPAVSRAIAELERAVGFSLFDRVRGRLVATPEAKLLVQEVERSFVGLDRVRGEAARIRDFGSGSIRIASQSALGNTTLPRAIRRFHERNPDIVLTLQIHSTAAVRDMVANGVFDLGLVADEVDLSGIEHRVFGSVAGVCVMPPGHPLAAKSIVAVRDLDRQRFIALAPEDRARRRLEAQFEREAIRPQIIVETPSSSTVCALALEGVGVGMANPWSMDGFVERGLVVRPLAPAVQFKSFVIFRPDSQQTRLVRAFVAELLKARYKR